jgi:hypothetical protein
MKHEPYIALVRAVDVGYYNTKYTLGLNEDGSEIKTDLERREPTPAASS